MRFSIFIGACLLTLLADDMRTHLPLAGAVIHAVGLALAFSAGKLP